jgi:hypothetical protein
VDVDAVMLAMGSALAGYALLRQSGSLLLSFGDHQDDDGRHREYETMVATVPSLFTLYIANDLLDVPHATISYRPPVVGAAGPSPHHDGDEAAAVAAQDDDSVATTSKNNQNHEKQKTSARRWKRGRGGSDDVITQAGALLITHDRGLSGPAALRLSAFVMAEHQ